METMAWSSSLITTPGRSAGSWARLGRGARVGDRLLDDLALGGSRRRALEHQLAEEVAHREVARRIVVLLRSYEAALYHRHVGAVLLEAALHVAE